MYRCRPATKRAAVACESRKNTVEAVHPVEDSTPASQPKASLDVSIEEAVVAYKTRLMAPFMLYDKKLQKVVANPAHDRVFRSEVSQVAGVVLRELRQVMELESRSTPKELLYGVQKSVMLAFSSCALLSDTESLVPISSDEEAATFISRLEGIFAKRGACPKAVASLTAVLSTGIVQETFGKACKRLEARLAEEGSSSVDSGRTKEEKLALIATKKNTRDFVQLYFAMVTAFNTISISFNTNPRTTLHGAAGVDTRTAQLTVQAYHNLLGWVLMLQPERLCLASAASAPLVKSSSQEQKQNFTKVLSFNATSGSIVIERTDSTCKWGVMLNTEGELVGLENALRNATPAGEELYHALQQQKTALRIYSINGVVVRDLNMHEQKAISDETKALIWEKIRGVLDASNRVLSLEVEKITTMGAPEEVAFKMLPQGGEGASGQQAVLTLKRSSTEVQWRLNVRVRTEGLMLLDSFSDSLPISEETRRFLQKHSGHLVILQVNGCEVSKNSFLVELIRSSLYLALHFQVVDDVERLAAERGAPPLIKENTAQVIEAGVGEVVDEPSKQDPEMAEEEEAEVAQHRALLQQHYISPDEPLPEVEMETSKLPSTKKAKSGRSKKAMTEMKDDVDVAPMPELYEPADEPLPEVEMETSKLPSTKKAKSGRSKKAMTEMKDDVDVAPMPELYEPADEPLPEVEMETSKLPSTKKTKKKVSLKETTPKKKKLLKKGKKSKEEKNKSHVDEINADEALKTVMVESELSEFSKGPEKKKTMLDGQFEEKKLQPKLATKVNTEVNVNTKPSTSPGLVIPTSHQTMDSTFAPVAHTGLEKAPPLTFENAVTLDRFDGFKMEIRRPDIKTPWKIEVSLSGDKMMLTRLPPFSAALKTHPFIKALQPDADGRIRWCVDGVNGTDLTTASKSLRAKAMESIKKSSKIFLNLRPFIK